jgi:hypothetical protein
MLGLVMTLVAATAPALPAADVVAACGERAGSCELAPIAQPTARREEWATPAVIFCLLAAPSTSPSPSPLPAWAFGECDWPHDASYRTSRFPESEDTQSLSPASRDRRSARSSCDGLPGKAPALPLSDAQPIALYATPVVVHIASAARPPDDASPPPHRFGDPPDRPPRV